jgi:aspartate/methionine/tyrosine aminotransferase
VTGNRSAERIRSFKTSIFAEMSALAAQHGAVNLGQGFPDFAAPDFVKDAAIAAIRDEHNQYAPVGGVMRLRVAIADDWQRRYGRRPDPELEVTVTTGATEGIFASIQALINPGDDLLTFEPFYDSYPASVTLAGGTMKVVRLQAPDWELNIDALRAAITPRTRVLLLNTPHNPTGKVFLRHELEAIAALCIERDLIVIADEVYDRIVYDGHVHIPIATLPGMWERTLTINSTGKTFSLTGWKIGYAVGPAELVRALRTVRQFVTFATSTPFQEAMATALTEAPGRGYYDTLRREYATRRRALAHVLTDAGFTVLDAQGSYFLLTDFAGQDHATDEAFCRWLIEETGVAAIPPSAFYHAPETAPPLARFCFAKDVSTIEEAGRRLLRMRDLAPQAGRP